MESSASSKQTAADPGTAKDGAIRPFSIEVPQEDLDELRRRITATRWPSKELVDDRSQGVQLATIQALSRYWTMDYDWRACEAKLNALPQFVTEIDGVEIHFIHVKSDHEDAMPLIMTHGWPGSVIELLEAVGPLTDPTAHGGRAEDAFHLVLPSLPGYGFSGEPTEVGWDPGRVAARLGGADAPPRLHPLRRPGRRRGRLRHRRDGPPGTGGAARHSHQPARAGAGHDRPIAGGIRRGTRGARCARRIQGERLWLLPGAGDAAADDRLRPAGFTRRPGGLDARPRHRQLLQDLARLSRRGARGQSHPGTHRRQHHDLLADRHRGLGGAVVLGERTSPSRSSCGRPGSSGGLDPGGLHHVPRRDLPGSAQLGRAGVSRLSPTSTRWRKAATSPPGRSPSSSRPSSGQRSARCVDRRRVNEKKRLDQASTRQQPPGITRMDLQRRVEQRTLYPATTQPPSTWIT